MTGESAAPATELMAITRTSPTAPRRRPLALPFGFGSSFLSLTTSPLEVHDLLEHLVGGRDRLRVGAERALMGDEVDELGREIDVGLLERARGHGPAASGARHAESRVTALARGDPEVVARPAQTFV